MIAMVSLPQDSTNSASYMHQDRLRCGSKEDKKAGVLERAREKESLQAQLETEQMAGEDEACTFCT